MLTNPLRDSRSIVAHRPGWLAPLGIHAGSEVVEPFVGKADVSHRYRPAPLGDDVERALAFSERSDVLLAQGELAGARAAAEQALLISRRLSAAGKP